MEKPENHRYLEDLARIKQNNLNLLNNLTLKNQCLDQILLHNRHFSDLASEHRCNPLENLPVPLKTDILKKASKKFNSSADAEDNYAFLRLLVHPQLKLIYLPIFQSEDFAPGYPTHFKTVLELLVEQVPNLLEIKCSALVSCPAPVADLLYNTLCKLKKLQDVSCPHAVCNSFHLQRLAENLPNLRLLHVSMQGYYSPRAYIALSRLQHLRYFYFSTMYESFGRYDTYYKQCTKYLPQLLRADNSDEECQCHNFLGKWREPITLNREHIDFEHRFRAIPEHCKLPNVWSMSLGLDVGMPQHPQTFFIPFDKLTSLSLLYVRQMDLFTDVLKAVGHQLVRLKSVDCECRSIFEIFTLCPKLEDFSCLSDFDVSGAPPKTTPEKVRYLKKLEMEVCEDTFNYPGVVSDLLHAPQLRSVKFYSLHLEQEEGERLSKLVREGVILQKLEDVSCHRNNLNLFGTILIDHMTLYRPLGSDCEI